MKKLISLIIILCSFSTFAECNNAYKDKIKNIEGRMGSPRATALGQTMAAAISTGVIIAATGTITVAAAVGIPAAAIGAGTYYTVLQSQKVAYRKAMHVISDAHKGEGPVLEKFLKRLNIGQKEEINREEVIQFLTQGDFDNQFCVANLEKDTVKLASFHDLLKLTRQELEKKN